MHGWCPPDSRVYNEAQAERAWSWLLALFASALSSVNYFGLLATIILAGSGATWTGVESMVMA